MTKKKPEVLPESLFGWERRILAEPITDPLPVQQASGRPRGNAGRLVEQIQKAGFGLTIEAILHERHCDLNGVCACAVRAIVQFPARYRRKGQRHIVRLHD